MARVPKGRSRSASSGNHAMERCGECERALEQVEGSSRRGASSAASSGDWATRETLTTMVITWRIRDTPAQVAPPAQGAKVGSLWATSVSCRLQVAEEESPKPTEGQPVEEK